MKRIYLHSLPLRIWHWSNALIVIILLATGIYLRFSGVASLQPHDPYLIIHKYAGWAMTVSFLFWFIYSIISRNLLQNYLMRGRDIKGIWSQTVFYLYSIFRGEQNPFRPSAENKFNPLQKIAYGSVMFILAPMLIITGLLYTDIDVLRSSIIEWDAVGIANAIHIAAAYALLLFLIMHLYMATLGPSPLSHTRAMITGYEEEQDDDPVESNPDGASETGEQSAEAPMASALKGKESL
jgi:thiosulfate reductase cytochrome b subunit